MNAAIKHIVDKYDLNEDYVEQRFSQMKANYEKLKPNRRMDNKDLERALSSSKTSAVKLLQQLGKLPLHWLHDTEVVLQFKDMLPDLILVLKEAESHPIKIKKNWHDSALNGWLCVFYENIKTDDEYVEFLSLALPYFDIESVPENFMRLKSMG